MAKIDGKQIKPGSIPNSVLTTPAGAPTKTDKAKTPNATTGNADSGLTITSAPSGGSMVEVMVNGVAQTLGDGVKTKDCFFSGDNGATARAINAIAANDKLYWNGVITGFDLAATDVVDFYYNV
jgi:hypothetical protein